jgi:ABC-type bacteriocin/lantibiotic exporter with double-glycine peptidase domain
MAINFKDCEAVSDRFRESGDCTVKALAIAGQMPYKKAHAHLAEHGRKPRKGMTLNPLKEAYEKAGLVLKQVMTGARTINQFEQRADKTKVYLVLTRGHIVAVRHGVVQDWTKGRRHQPKLVWEVTRKQSKNAERKAKRYGKCS